MTYLQTTALLLLPFTASSAVHGKWEDRDDFKQVHTSTHNLNMINPFIDLTFAVKQQNLQQLENLVLKVSDPDSKAYGQHLTHDQVHSLTANVEAAAAVREWSSQHGLTLKTTSSHDEYLTYVAPLSLWNTLLDSKFVQMQHTESGESILRSKEFTMPNALEQHVAHIFNVVELPLRKGPGVQVRKMTDAEIQKDQKDVLELAAPYPWPCKSTMKLGCWNYRYNQTTNDATGETQMVFGQKGAYMAPDDIVEFAGANHLDPLSKTSQIWSCPNGGCSNSACQGYDPNMKNKGHLCVEGNMDVQFMSGIAQNANNTFYWNTNLATPFIEFITHISSLSAPPGTVSISYGSYEYEMDHAVMDHFSMEAMKLGAQGVSILAATGDDGVAGYKARNDTTKCQYTASFPATCPWVTAVGATQNAENDPDDHEVHTLQEYAANAPEQQPPFFAVTTAGGFSNYFAVPKFQTAAVANYFTTPESKRAPAGYNTTGRGFPDIASNGMNYQVFIDSNPCLVCGTSGAAPSVGGMVTTINAQRKKAGKPRLGFLNPLFYTRPSILNDIAHGWNNCTAIRTVCCPMGFTSASGWDPLVGLGSPSYVRFVKQSGGL